MIVKIQDSAIKDLKKIDKTTALLIAEQIKRLELFPNIPNIKKLPDAWRTDPHLEKLFGRNL